MSSERPLSDRIEYELPDAPDREIWDIWLSTHRLPAMAIADELGIFQAIEKAPATEVEAAQRLNLNRRATGILLSMLRALKLVVLRDGRHEIADVTRTYLLPQSPHYWGPLLRTLGVVPQQRAALLRALRAPNEEQKATPSSKPELWASDAWARGQMDRAQAETVCRIMHCHSLPASVGMARSGGFGRVRHLLDVGGGSGCFAIAIAQHVPSIRCTVMELPAVCEVARGYIDAAGVSHRVNAVPVDMFRNAWPRGHDGVLFSNVFHDWNADTNSGLARRAYETLPRDGRVFVHEMLMADDGSGPVTTASFSMLMLLETQGRQYSFGEVRQTLMHAGFVDITVQQTHGYYSLVSGRRP